MTDNNVVKAYQLNNINIFEDELFVNINAFNKYKYIYISILLLIIYIIDIHVYIYIIVDICMNT
jgi:hypothetical protein